MNIIPYPPTNQNTNPYYSKDLNNKLLFMRHGQTDFNADKSFSRKMNPIYVDCRIEEDKKNWYSFDKFDIVAYEDDVKTVNDIIIKYDNYL